MGADWNVVYFFRLNELIFRALPKHGLVPVLAKFFSARFPPQN